MKPNGLSFGVGAGGLQLRVGRPSLTEDKVWEAVESALDAGWTPERFKRECAEAWEDYLQRRVEDEGKEMRR